MTLTPFKFENFQRILRSAFKGLSSEPAHYISKPKTLQECSFRSRMFHFRCFFVESFAKTH